MKLSHSPQETIEQRQQQAREKAVSIIRRKSIGSGGRKAFHPTFDFLGSSISLSGIMKKYFDDTPCMESFLDSSGIRTVFVNFQQTDDISFSHIDADNEFYTMFAYNFYRWMAQGVPLEEQIQRYVRFYRDQLQTKSQYNSVLDKADDVLGLGITSGMVSSMTILPWLVNDHIGIDFVRLMVDSLEKGTHGVEIPAKSKKLLREGYGYYVYDRLWALEFAKDFSSEVSMTKHQQYRDDYVRAWGKESYKGEALENYFMEHVSGRNDFLKKFREEMVLIKSDLRDSNSIPMFTIEKEFRGVPLIIEIPSVTYLDEIGDDELSKAMLTCIRVVKDTKKPAIFDSVVCHTNDSSESSDSSGNYIATLEYKLNTENVKNDELLGNEFVFFQSAESGDLRPYFYHESQNELYEVGQLGIARTLSVFDMFARYNVDTNDFAVWLYDTILEMYRGIHEDAMKKETKMNVKEVSQLVQNFQVEYASRTVVEYDWKNELAPYIPQEKNEQSKKIYMQVGDTHYLMGYNNLYELCALREGQVPNDSAHSIHVEITGQALPEGFTLKRVFYDRPDLTWREAKKVLSDFFCVSDPERQTGSHQRVNDGERQATVLGKDGESVKNTINGVLRQLGICRDLFYLAVHASFKKKGAEKDHVESLVEQSRKLMKETF